MVSLITAILTETGEGDTWHIQIRRGRDLGPDQDLSEEYHQQDGDQVAAGGAQAARPARGLGGSGGLRVIHNSDVRGIRVARPLVPASVPVKLVAVRGLVAPLRALEVKEGRGLGDVLPVPAAVPGLGVVELLAGVVAVVVVIVVEVTPVTAALGHVLVIKEPGEALVGDGDPGGGLGLAEIRHLVVGLSVLWTLQFPLWCVTSLLLTVAVIDPVGLSTVVKSYWGAGSHDGAIS